MEQLVYADLYKNKLIDAGEYLARVVSVDVVPQKNGTNSYQIVGVLDGNEAAAEGTRLTAILNGTAKGQRIVDAFCDSFRVTEKTVQEAVGRYAGVWVYQTEYKGTTYSAIKFHAQFAQVQQAALEAEEDFLSKKGKSQALADPSAESGPVQWAA